MDGKKLALYLILIISVIAIFSQTPMMQAVGTGQHKFISGKMVDCVKCHQHDAFNDMNTSQAIVLGAHKRAAANKNYTTYLEVGGIKYDPSGIIYTNVDIDGNGNDIWTWNGSFWIYNNTAKLYDLDMDSSGGIEGAEICKFCHSLDLMGLSGINNPGHTTGTRYCDDDRCHGNRNHSYNDYLLFSSGTANLTSVGMIVSNNSVHGTFYNEAAGIDASQPTLHSYNMTPGNIAPGNIFNISSSPYTCLGCHSFINVSGSIVHSSLYSHNDSNPSRGRYS